MGIHQVGCHNIGSELQDDIGLLGSGFEVHGTTKQKHPGQPWMS